MGILLLELGVTREPMVGLADNKQCVDANADLVCDRTDVQFLGNGSFVAWEE